MSFLGFHGMYRSSGSFEGYKGTVPTNSERWYVKRSGGKLEKTALDYGIITTAELGHIKDTPHWKPELYTKTETPVSALMDGDIISSGKKETLLKYFTSKRRACAVVMSENNRWLFWAGKNTMETAITMAVLSCELKSEVKCHVIGMDDKLTRTLAEIEADDFK